jgi:hypothetical protein
MSGVHVLMRTALAIRCPPEVGTTRCIVVPARLRGIVRPRNSVGLPGPFSAACGGAVIYCECRWYRLTSKTVAAFSSGRFLPLRERRCSALFTTPYPLHRSVGNSGPFPPPGAK